MFSEVKLIIFAFVFFEKSSVGAPGDLYRAPGGLFSCQHTAFQNELIKAEANANFVSIFGQLLGTAFLAEVEKTTNCL